MGKGDIEALPRRWHILRSNNNCHPQTLPIYSCTMRGPGVPSLLVCVDRIGVDDSYVLRIQRKELGLFPE